mmetsp:Transcript_28553/g.84062  ORF Transcript_28553/g.84062 Transcript_28553/m.84062 type:complete len:460 (+) Transcript_28553:834-2213(+)
MRVGSTPHAVRKHVRLIVLDAFHQAERIRMFLLGLPAESGDKIRAQRDVRYARAHVVDEAQIGLAGVSPPHPSQHRRRSRLRRHVQVIAHVGTLGHEFQQRRRIILGVRAGETDAELGADEGYGVDQVGEVMPRPAAETIQVGESVVGRFVPPRALFRLLLPLGRGEGEGGTGRCGRGALVVIRIDVLPQQYHLPHAVPFVQSGAFVDDAVEIAGSFAAAGERYDAVRAHVVAAPHDGHKGGHVLWIGGGGGGRVARVGIGGGADGIDVGVRLVEIQLDVDGPFHGLGPTGAARAVRVVADQVGREQRRDQSRQIPVRVRARDQIGRPVLEHILLEPFGHAPQDADHALPPSPGQFSPLPPPEIPPGEAIGDVDVDGAGADVLDGKFGVPGAEFPESMPHLLLGAFAYGARVGEKDVGVQFRRRFLEGHSRAPEDRRGGCACGGGGVIGAAAVGAPVVQ